MFELIEFITLFLLVTPIGWFCIGLALLMIWCCWIEPALGGDTRPGLEPSAYQRAMSRRELREQAAVSEWHQMRNAEAYSTMRPLTEEDVRREAEAGRLARLARERRASEAPTPKQFWAEPTPKMGTVKPSYRRYW